MSKYTLLVIIFLSIIVSSCKKEIISFGFSEKKRLNVTELDFEYFQARSKIKFDDGLQNFNANAHVRIKKDSIIWISISSSIGIEVIRAVISPDSVFIIDRMNKDFIAIGIDSLQQKFDLPINYAMLQSALVGNLIKKRERSDKVTKTEGFFILRQENQNLMINNMVNSKTMKVEKVSIIDEPGNSSMEIEYNDFQFVSKKLLPHDNAFHIAYKKSNSDSKTDMNIAYTRVSVDEKKIKFPFNIPNKYVSNE